MTEITGERWGELVRGLCSLLAQQPEGLPATEVLRPLETLVPPTEFEDRPEADDFPVRLYEKMVRSATIKAVKAGVLVKNQGTLSLTEKGRFALQMSHDPEIFLGRRRTLKRPLHSTRWDKIAYCDVPLIVRTNFEHPERWQWLYELILAPYPRVPLRGVQFVSDVRWRDLSVEALLTALPFYEPSFLFVADHETLQSLELPVLVVDRYREPGRTFRTLPAEVLSIVANLSLANLFFSEFADAADEDGVYRGVSRGKFTQSPPEPAA